MTIFIPKRVYYEPQSLDYPLGMQLVEHFRHAGITVIPTSSHNRVTGLTGKSATETYREAKRTLVIGVRRSQTFQTCKPSANYQLPLVTSCPGMCEYCYLATTLGPKPYLRVYVNLEEILGLAAQIMKSRLPEITVFEGAATSDPLPLEHYTGSLKKTIEFFGTQPHGRFRFVTKFSDVDNLLAAEHRGHTRFRFSLNCEHVVKHFEHGTPGPIERIKAAAKVLAAGYPLGFIVAPIMIFEKWQEEYTKLFILLANELEQHTTGVSWSPVNLSFEFISHRFTSRAKTTILKVFPASTLPMEEDTRKYKYGQFGYGKYIYQPEEMNELKTFFKEMTEKFFPGAQVEYFV